MKKQLVDKKIKEAIDMRKSGYSLAEIGFYFGVSKQRISQILKNHLTKKSGSRLPKAKTK